MGDQKPQVAVKAVEVPGDGELAKSGTATMSDEDRLRGRAIHAEARAAAAEAQAAKLSLQVLMESIPEIRQARAVVVQTEQALASAQVADDMFRLEVGGRLGLDLSRPRLAKVNWETGEVTLEEADGP